MAIEYICKNCGTTFARYLTTENLCNKCKYNKLMALRESSGATRKPIIRVGKRAMAWIDERNMWIKNNPPDEFGYWYCYLRTTALCPVRLDIDQLTLDHVIPRSSHKSSFQKAELAPACAYCNGDKGSQSLENYLATHKILKPLDIV